MKTKRLILISLLLLILAFTFIRFDIEQNSITSISENQDDPIKIVTVKAWENLQIFIIEGEKRIPEKNYVILSEALKKEFVTLKETSQVNELSINNNSNHYIFIHSGDVVKGGRQDRTISYDVIIPPETKDIPLTSFCVESSRWAKRGNESDTVFSENSVLLSSRNLKVASKVNNNQSQVWNEVAAEQKELSANVGYMSKKDVDITANASSSSLQLSLENEDLDSIRNSYKVHFESLLDNYPAATGFAYAINGEVYGIEIYNNRSLFNDLWEKLLNASIVESISDMVKDPAFEAAKEEDIFQLMSKVKKAKKETKEINSETLLHTYKVKDAVLFTTIDQEINDWVHKNYIAIDTTMSSSTEPGINDLQQQNNYENNSIDFQQIQQNRIIQH